MRIRKRIALVGVALAAAAPCPACDGSSGAAKESPADTAGMAHWAGIDPLKGRADVEKVRGGFTFTEGPVWIAPKGVLLFTDIPADTIHQLQPPATITVFRMPSGKSNGLGLDAQGRLIASEHDDRRVSRTMADGSVVAVAARSRPRRRCWYGCGGSRPATPADIAPVAASKIR